MQSNQAVISTDQLSQQLASVKVLDCSSAMGRAPEDDHRANFHRTHIQGALFVDMDYFKEMRSDLPFTMPSEKQFVDTMKRLNVKLTDTVVCYDTGAMGFFAHRAAWMIHAMGHPDVRVLDGGFAKWVKEGKPVGGKDEGAGDFGYKLNPDRIKNFDEMKAFADSSDQKPFQVIDARGPPQFEAGNISGAVNIPFS